MDISILWSQGLFWWLQDFCRFFSLHFHKHTLLCSTTVLLWTHWMSDGNSLNSAKNGLCHITRRRTYIKKGHIVLFFLFHLLAQDNILLTLKNTNFELENSRRFIKKAYRKGSIIKRTERSTAYAQQISKRAKTHLPFIRRGFSTIKATDRAAPNQIGHMLYIVWSTWFPKRCFESPVYDQWSCYVLRNKSPGTGKAFLS